MVNRRGFVLGAAGVGAASIMASGTASAGEPAVSLNVVYPNHDGARFDTNYYRSTHIPLAMKVMKATSVKLIEGMPNGSSAPPIAMIAYFEFMSAEAMKAGLANPAMSEVRADIAKFTDIKPLVMQGRTL
jgi:uncharacterized protein (TIGR02118 family)